MAVVYGLIARGSSILADYSKEEGNYGDVAKRLLQKYKPNPVMMSYAFGSHYFHMYTKKEITFVWLAEDALGKELALRFLWELSGEYTPEYTANKAAFARIIKLLVDKYATPQDKFG